MTIQKLKRILLSTALIIAFSGAVAQAIEPVIITEQTKSISLGRNIEIFEDSSLKLDIKEVASAAYAGKFKRSTVEYPNYGFNATDYWVRFRIRNMTGRDGSWYLELGYPHMDKMTVYVEEGDGSFPVVKKYGDVYPFAQRDINYRNMVSIVNMDRNEDLVVYAHFSGRCSKEFPLTLWNPAAFAEMVIKEKFVLGMYYGIIIVMVLYNLFLFFFVRDRSYLFYVIYILSYGFVQIAYNGMAFAYLWPSFPAWHNISLPFLIGLTVLLMILFSKSFLHCRDFSRKLDWYLSGIMGLCGGIMVFSLLGDYLVAIRLAMLIMVIASISIVTSGVLILRNGYRPARFFLIAWAAFLCGVILIALNKLSVLPSVFITEYAIQIGSALEVTLLSIAMADRINVMDAEKRTAQLEKMKAQEKYKLLVEGSGDIIFTLDEHWVFQTANLALKAHLNIHPQSIIGKNFIDLIYERHDGEDVSRRIVLEKLELFSKERAPVTFNAEFKSLISTEPKEMQVRLEYVSIEGKNEVLGKATTIDEDILLKYFKCEKQQFSIGNYLLIADDVTQRITRNLKKFIDAKTINLVRLALREIIINAIEHGNLNITFEEKSETLDNENYFDFVAQRREDPKFKDRRVHIEYIINAEKAMFKITDEGEGFDFQKIVDGAAEQANEDMLSHGRGLAMAMNIFDNVEFGAKGNQVLLVKKFGPVEGAH